MQFKIAVFQFNPLVGDLVGNTDRLVLAIEEAKGNNCNLFIAPELAICGYPPEDLIFRQDFYLKVEQCIAKLLTIEDITLIIGCPRLEDNKHFNSALVIQDGKVVYYDKQCLPNYGVFDEKRYFTPGTKPQVIKCGNVRFGVLICEDMWLEKPVVLAEQAGAEIICILNASPFNVGKQNDRLATAKNLVAKTKLPLIYVNQVGGQDDLVFDGASFALNCDGDLVTQCSAFKEELQYCEYKTQDLIAISPLASYPQDIESIYLALVLAVHDYVAKNGFKKVVLGLSGGIDSALTLAIAVDALGKDRVMAVMMPSQYTADISLADSREMAQWLGVSYQEITIEPIVNEYKQQLATLFHGLSEDLTEENLQARVRGTLLMAVSNKFGYLVLTTGNKSEMATGYATLYGDMAGGFALLKDVLKTEVYQLSNWRNLQSKVIPGRIIERAPSAELRANQVDQDSLPEYDVLDQIIRYLVEDDLSASQIITLGFDAIIVSKVAKLIKINEYKRYQAAVGPKVSCKAFARDWRYPISSGFTFYD